MKSRFLAVGLAMAMMTSACGDGSEPETTGTTGAPETTSGTSAPRGSSDDVPAALVAAGITVVDEPGAFGGDGLVLWSYQVETMARELDAGSGYLGSELDALAGSPGGLSFSYLVAGWLSAGATPAAEAARSLMGDQPWAQAPNLTYPTVVLAMFVGDALQAGAPAASQRGRVILASLAQEGVCSTLAGWVNGVLGFIFDSLKVMTDDDGFLGWLGGVWNAAVDLARDFITGLVETLTAPIVAAISSALAVIGTLSMIASLLKPWEIELESSHAQTRFAVGSEADIRERFTATVDTGLDVSWPAAIVDCASVAGLDLPDPSSAASSPIRWTVAGLPPLGTVDSQGQAIDDDNTAVLAWVTGREASDRGTARSGSVSVSVTVTSAQVEKLKAMLELLITAQTPAPPFGSIVSGLFEGLAGPVFDVLADLVQVRGAGSAVVVFHDEETTTTAASPPESDGLDSCVVGTWVSTEWTMPGPAGLDATGGAGAVITVKSDGATVWSFDDMEPLIMEDDQIDVTTEFHTEGKTTGSVSASDGVWDASADVSGMEGYSIDNILGKMSQAGGPGLFVGVLDGSYTCSGSTLTIVTTDPVEGVPVTVVLSAQ